MKQQTISKSKKKRKTAVNDIKEENKKKKGKKQYIATQEKSGGTTKNQCSETKEPSDPDPNSKLKNIKVTKKNFVKYQKCS